MRSLALIIIITVSSVCWTLEVENQRENDRSQINAKRDTIYEPDHVIVKKTEIEGPNHSVEEQYNEKRGFLANLASLLTEAEELSASKGGKEIKINDIDQGNGDFRHHSNATNATMSSVARPSKSTHHLTQLNASNISRSPTTNLAPIFAYYHGRIVPLGELNENSFKSKNDSSMLTENKEFMSKLKNMEDQSNGKTKSTLVDSTKKQKANSSDELLRTTMPHVNNAEIQPEILPTEGSSEKESPTDGGNSDEVKHLTPVKKIHSAVVTSKATDVNEQSNAPARLQPEMTKKEAENVKEASPTKDKEEAVTLANDVSETEKTKVLPSSETDKSKDSNASVNTEADAAKDNHDEEAVSVEESHVVPEHHPSFETKSNPLDENASRRGTQQSLPHAKAQSKPKDKPQAKQLPKTQATSGHPGLSVLNQTQYRRLLHYLSTLDGKTKARETSKTEPSSRTVTAIAKDEVSFPDMPTAGSPKSEVLEHVKGILLDNGKVVPFTTKQGATADHSDDDTSSSVTKAMDSAASHGDNERFSVTEDGGLVPLTKDKPMNGDSSTRELAQSGEKTVSLSVEMLKDLLKKADSKVSLAQLLNKTPAAGQEAKENAQEEDPGTIEDFAAEGLKAHNLYRAEHHSPPLVWSDALATKAQKFAEELADKKTLEISKDLEKDGSGENVAKVWATFKTAGNAATKMWFSQSSNYHFDDPHLDENTGQFAQVVWKDTKELGMGVAKSIDDVNNHYVYVVALYNPAGNIEATLRSEVLPVGNNTVDVYSTFFKRTATKRSGIAKVELHRVKNSKVERKNSRRTNSGREFALSKVQPS